MHPDDAHSPRIAALQAALAKGASTALADFWADIARIGTPLIEPIADDPEHYLVTFLWRAHEPLDNVLVLGGWHGYYATPNHLLHLPATDLWYRTWRMRSDTYGSYHLLPNDPFDDARRQMRSRAAQPDPFNRQTFLVPKDDANPDDFDLLFSVFSLPDAPACPYVQARATVTKGNVSTHHFRSTLLHNERRVLIYTPAAVDPAGPEPWLLLLFDGLFYTYALNTPTILDNLHADGQLPPLVAVMVDSPDRETRYQELHCSAPFTAMLVQELLPWVRQHYRVSADPAHTIIGGASHGGLAAAFTAFTYPQVFGNVLSQSGSFEWYPAGEPSIAWLPQQFAAQPTKALRFYLNVGQREIWPPPKGNIDRLASNRQMQAVLQAKHYPLSYQELNGGHEYLLWRDTLADALITLTQPHTPTAQP